MTNILTKNFDITDFFTNDKLDKIAEISVNLSEHSKITDIPLLSEYKTKKDNDFAVVLISPRGDSYPKYAMYNAGLTELNMAFLSAVMSELPEEIIKTAATNLTTAAKNFNLEIPENLQKYASSKFTNRYIDLVEINEKNYVKKLAELQEDSKTEVFALKNRYPITDINSLNKTAKWFSKNYSKLDIDEQQEFIANFTKQAEVLNAKIPTLIDEFNSLDKKAFNEDFKHHLNIRKSYIEDEEESVLDDLWLQKDEIGPYKVAYVLEAIDKELNLDSLYGDRILDPLRSTLSQEKTANIQYNGTTVNQSDLMALKNTDLGPIVGEGIVSELKSDNGLVVFNSLPEPIKDEILELL